VSRICKVLNPIERFYLGLEGRIFGFYGLRTWEWDPSFPVRSIMPPFLTTGIPFLLAKLTLNGRS
jgi:phosphatidylinositol glycan class Z